MKKSSSLLSQLLVGTTMISLVSMEPYLSQEELWKRKMETEPHGAWECYKCTGLPGEHSRPPTNCAKETCNPQTKWTTCTRIHDKKINRTDYAGCSTSVAKCETDVNYDTVNCSCLFDLCNGEDLWESIWLRAPNAIQRPKWKLDLLPRTTQSTEAVRQSHLKSLLRSRSASKGTKLERMRSPSAVVESKRDRRMRWNVAVNRRKSHVNSVL